MLALAGYAGLWAALAGSALFFGAGTVLDRYQAQPGVSIALSDWSWLGSLKVGFEKPAPAIPIGISEPAPLVGPVVTEAKVAEVAVKPVVVAKATHHTAIKKSAHHEKLLRSIARIKSETSDRLTVSRAEAIPAPVLSEAERMQNLRVLLRGRFLASVDTQPVTLVAVAAPVVTQSPIKRAAVKTHHKPKLAIQPRTLALIPVPTAPIRPAAELIQEQGKLISGLNQKTIQLPGIPVTISIPKEKPDPGITDSITQVAAAPAPTPPSITTQTATGATVSISIPPSSMATTGTLVAQNEATAANGYSTQFGYSSYPHITVAVASQNTPPAQATQPAAVSSQVSHHVVAEVTPQSPTPSYVEAFEWATPVTPSHVEPISNERGGAPGEVLGWDLTRAENHWPTLTWKAGVGATRVVPLVSNNALFFLANLAQPSVKVQNGAGIVFGKVAAGWNVELSGRAERPVFLTADGRQVAIGDMESDRYFAFLNVEPGSHLIYLMNRLGTAGVVAIPALSGVSTYADVTQPVQRTVTGHVYDSGSSKFAGLSNVQVRVVGQQNANVTTGASGDFRIANVTVIDHFPLYLETDADIGATHRYRVLAGQEGNLSLYRLRDEQVRELVDQLEGGVSQDSGLIVAATPQIVESEPEGLFPSVYSLLPTPTLRPETYTMDNSGQLEVNTSLTADAVRFASVQVPDGPALARLENKAQANVWSELVFAQARIVNIVGPY